MEEFSSIPGVYPSVQDGIDILVTPHNSPDVLPNVYPALCSSPYEFSRQNYPDAAYRVVLRWHVALDALIGFLEVNTLSNRLNIYSSRTPRLHIIERCSTLQIVGRVTYGSSLSCCIDIKNY